MKKIIIFVSILLFIGALIVIMIASMDIHKNTIMKNFFEKIKGTISYLYFGDDDICGLIWGITCFIVIMIIYKLFF